MKYKIKMFMFEIVKLENSFIKFILGIYVLF